MLFNPNSVKKDINNMLAFISKATWDEDHRSLIHKITIGRTKYNVKFILDNEITELSIKVNEIKIKKFALASFENKDDLDALSNYIFNYIKNLEVKEEKEKKEEKDTIIVKNKRIYIGKGDTSGFDLIEEYEHDKKKFYLLKVGSGTRGGATGGHHQADKAFTLADFNGFKNFLKSKGTEVGKNFEAKDKFLNGKQVGFHFFSDQHPDEGNAIRLNKINDELCIRYCWIDGKFANNSELYNGTNCYAVISESNENDTIQFIKSKLINILDKMEGKAFMYG